MGAEASEVQPIVWLPPESVGAPSRCKAGPPVSSKSARWSTEVLGDVAAERLVRSIMRTAARSAARVNRTFGFSLLLFIHSTFL